MDLSYLSVASAVPQLEELSLAATAELIALVKPMFELGLDAAPDDERSLDRARDAACAGVASMPWTVRGTMPSPVTGAKGAREWLLHAVRATR
jgi:predicted rRNA methylase YqxC with S4 and FtsJ domains